VRYFNSNFVVRCLEHYKSMSSAFDEINFNLCPPDNGIDMSTYRVLFYCGTSVGYCNEKKIVNDYFTIINNDGVILI